VTWSTDTFDDLYRAHAASVYRRALRLLQNDADALEVVNDVFTSLYERPEQYAGRSALSTYLYGVTTNACFNRIRSHKQRARLFENARGARIGASEAPCPERVTQLRDLLERMPEPLAQAAVYYYLDDLTHEEIAEILGCSRRHVGNLLARLSGWARATTEEKCP
jgi:RNA polymerase sigma factor (sigma-70 family)